MEIATPRKTQAVRLFWIGDGSGDTSPKPTPEFWQLLHEQKIALNSQLL
jgi:hypothetical protein